jgi:hypothetical protein
MILISCRKDFSDARQFSDRIIIRNYPFLPKLDQFIELDEMNLAAQMQGKHVLILVHGFRSAFQNVGIAYQRLLNGLINAQLVGEDAYGLVLGFAWPGFSTALGFFPAVPFANRSADSFAVSWNWPRATRVRSTCRPTALALELRCRPWAARQKDSWTIS